MVDLVDEEPFNISLDKYHFARCRILSELDLGSAQKLVQATGRVFTDCTKDPHILKSILAKTSIKALKMHWKNAVVKGNVHFLRFVLTHDSRVDPNQIFQYAAAHGHFASLVLMARYRGVDIAASNQHALTEAIAYGHYDHTVYLLSFPQVTPRVFENEALVMAAKFGRIGILEFLLTDPRADPSLWENAPLRAAVKMNQPQSVRVLISDPRVDPSVHGNYPLIHAARNDYIEIVQMLLNDPRTKPDARSNAALKAAAMAENIEIVIMLAMDPRVTLGEPYHWALRSRLNELAVLLYKCYISKYPHDPNAYGLVYAGNRLPRNGIRPPPPSRSSSRSPTRSPSRSPLRQENRL